MNFLAKCALPIPTSSELKYSPEPGKEYDSGTELSVSCPAGYAVKSEDGRLHASPLKSYCKRGVWTNTPKQCAKGLYKISQLSQFCGVVGTVVFV